MTQRYEATRASSHLLVQSGLCACMLWSFWSCQTPGRYDPQGHVGVALSSLKFPHFQYGYKIFAMVEVLSCTRCKFSLSWRSTFFEQKVALAWWNQSVDCWPASFQFSRNKIRCENPKDSFTKWPISVMCGLFIAWSSDSWILASKSFRRSHGLIHIVCFHFYTAFWCQGPPQGDSWRDENIDHFVACSGGWTWGSNADL